VSLRLRHHHYELEILAELETNTAVSQRTLARRLGIALGLTNLIIRKLVRRGWVHMIHVKANRVRYLITPDGLAEKARMSRDYLAQTIRFYADARSRIVERLDDLSASWPRDQPGNGDQGKRIAFYGGDEVAEIGYVCLQETDLSLVAVIDDQRTKPFFGVSVLSHTQLRDNPALLDPVKRIVVLSFSTDVQDAARQSFRDLGIHEDRVFWL
jgi:DNA-binding MarR family transcriptional regulator